MPAERRQLDLRRAAAALAGGSPTMAAIARELGVAKPTLYRLAGSREALVALCVDAEAERLLGHLHGSVPDVSRGVAAFARESPGGLELLLRPEARAAVRRVEDRLADLLRRAGSECDALDAARVLGGAAAAERRAAEEAERAASAAERPARGAGGTPSRDRAP